MDGSLVGKNVREALKKRRALNFGAHCRRKMDRVQFSREAMKLNGSCTREIDGYGGAETTVERAYARRRLRTLRAKSEPRARGKDKRANESRAVGDGEAQNANRYDDQTEKATSSLPPLLPVREPKTTATGRRKSAESAKAAEEKVTSRF